MTISQVCDLAYNLQLEMMEDRFRSLETAFYFAKSQADPEDDTPPPSFVEMVRKFDEDLNADFDSEEKDAFKRFYDLR